MDQKIRELQAELAKARQQLQTKDKEIENLKLQFESFHNKVVESLSTIDLLRPSDKSGLQLLQPINGVHRRFVMTEDYKQLCELYSEDIWESFDYINNLLPAIDELLSGDLFTTSEDLELEFEGVENE